MLFAVLVCLFRRGVFAQNLLCLVDRGKRHDEEHEDGDTEQHDGQRNEAPSDQSQKVAHQTLLSLF